MYYIAQNQIFESDKSLDSAEATPIRAWAEHYDDQHSQFGYSEWNNTLHLGTINEQRVFSKRQSFRFIDQVSGIAFHPDLTNIVVIQLLNNMIYMIDDQNLPLPFNTRGGDFSNNSIRWLSHYEISVTCFRGYKYVFDARDRTSFPRVQVDV